jgi:hypothetical protein
MRGLIAAGGSNAVRTNFVFHYRRLATAVNPDKAALEGAFNTAVATPIAAALNTDWSASLHDVRWVNDAEDAYASITATEAGMITGDRLQTFAAAYLLLRTGKRGKKFRGSKHFGPMSESDIGDDVFNATALGRLEAIKTAMLLTLTDGTGNQWKLTCLSRSLSQLSTNPTTVVTNDVTQILVRESIGTMRSRKVDSVY